MNEINQSNGLKSDWRRRGGLVASSADSQADLIVEVTPDGRLSW